MRSLIVAWMLALCALTSPAWAISEAEIVRAVRDERFTQARAMAEKSGNTLLKRYALWAHMVSDFPVAYSVSEAMEIVKTTSTWPLHNRVRMRVEEAALHSHADTGAMTQFCKQLPPISGRGMLACAKARVLDDKTRTEYIRQGWKQGDFRREEEQRILRMFARELTYADHRARIERLLFEHKPSAASRLMVKMNAADSALFRARMALRAGSRDAESKLRAVPTGLRNDAGLIFDRMQFRARKGLDAGVIEMLLVAPKDPPYADAWWPHRAQAVRDALRMGRPKDALSILEKRGRLDVVFEADALWLKGWVALEYLRDPRMAYEAFYALYNHAKFPVSKARAAYWAHVAASRNGNRDIAEEWLGKAAKFSTVFYGQIAQAQLHAGRPLALGDIEHASYRAAALASDSAVQVGLMLARAGEKDMAVKFFEHLASITDDEDRLADLGAAATHALRKFGGVRTAKAALRNHVVLLQDGWPLLDLPKNLMIEPALTLAITRQESEFNPEAKSSAGARGLMQLLPRTAAETARKIGVGFSPARIFEQTLNLTLGSAYLGRLVGAYGGALVPAIAAYNAGPGNVRKWITAYGMPGANLEQTLRWMESIPFAETRNYVQRVLENLQIYRAQLKPSSKLGIVQDIVR